MLEYKTKTQTTQETKIPFYVPRSAVNDNPVLCHTNKDTNLSSIPIHTISGTITSVRKAIVYGNYSVAVGARQRPIYKNTVSVQNGA